MYVFKTTGKDGKAHPRWRFQYTDHTGRKRTGTGTSSKADTIKQAERRQAYENEVRDKIRPAPKPSDTIREFETVVKEYRADGEAHGGREGFGWSEMHRYNIGKRLEWWRQKLSIRTLDDIAMRDVDKALNVLLTAKKAPKTVRNYAETIAAFCEWCVTSKYLDANPLTGLLKNYKGKTQEPHRELTKAEIDSLLAKAPAERALWYRVALATGYRQAEVRALKVRNLDVFGPSLPLAAEFCKNRKDARQPITRELCEELKALTTGKSPEASLLNMPGKRVTGQHFRADVHAAGIKDVITGKGKATFHSLRVNYINAVVQCGADLKTIMELARHSSATMSMSVYAKPDANRLRKAAEGASDLLLNVAASTTEAQRKIVGAEQSTVSNADASLCVVSEVKPSLGFEPRTYALRKHCSTAELRWRRYVTRVYNNGFL